MRTARFSDSKECLPIVIPWTETPSPDRDPLLWTDKHLGKYCLGPNVFAGGNLLIVVQCLIIELNCFSLCSQGLMFLFWYFVKGVLWSDVLGTVVREIGNVDIDILTNCALGQFPKWFGTNYSSALLAIISTEKFFALYFPFKAKTMCTVRTAKRVSAVTALIYVAYNLQFPFLVKVTTGIHGKFCGYGNVSRIYFRIASFILPTLYCYAPFTIMILTNSAIIHKFVMAKFRSRNRNTESTSQALSKSATRGTAMLLTVSFMFIILTGPNALLNIMWPDGNPPLPLVFDITGFMLKINFGINWIMYCLSAAQFGRELRKLFGCHKNSSNLNSCSTISTITASIKVNSSSVSELTSISLNP